MFPNPQARFNFLNVANVLYLKITHVNSACILPIYVHKTNQIRNNNSVKCYYSVKKLNYRQFKAVLQYYLILNIVTKIIYNNAASHSNRKR